jgi:serine/threonine protein kinase
MPAVLDMDMLHAWQRMQVTGGHAPIQSVTTGLPSSDVLFIACRYETTNHLWLILEYCVGGDLNTLLRQDVRLPESSVHDFGRDLVVALQYLHHNSIIYCDLKPSNILLDENGRLKLGGFGLSRRLADINKTPVQSLPQVRQQLGTAAAAAFKCRAAGGRTFRHGSIMHVMH